MSTWVETVADPCAEVELRWDGFAAALVTFELVSALEDDQIEAAEEAPPEAPPDGDEPPSAETRHEPALPLPPDRSPAGLRTSPPEERPLRADPDVGLTRPPEPAEPLGDRAPNEPTPPSARPPLVDDADEVDLSHLFETRHVGVEAAAVRSEGDDESTAGHENGPDPITAITPPVESPPAVHLLPPPTGAPVDAPPPPGIISGVPRPGSAADAGPDLGDHDGLTISPAQAAALRQGQAPATSAGASGTQLQAVACPSGHLNPPQAAECRACGAPIQDYSIRLVHRPSLGHLRFDGGLVADIDRPLLVGRKPTAEGLRPGDEVPGLVALPDPDGMLSRVHLELRIEGWEVLVVDRDSTNGTVIEIPGHPPVRLRPMEPVLITTGTRIALADTAVCTFETGPR